MKPIFIFLLIISIAVVGCSQGTDYTSQPQQKEYVGGGCGVQDIAMDSIKLINQDIQAGA